MLKKAALFLLIVLGFLFTVKPQAFAQTQNQPLATSNQPLVQQQSSTDANVPQNLHTYTQSVLTEVLASVICQVGGVDLINPNEKCLGVDQQTGKIGFVQNGGGLVAVESNMIGMMYNIPVHTGDYFQNLASNFGVSKKTYAAFPQSCSLDAHGLGFCGLQPLLGIWSKFRDISYLLFVAIFVFVGIAIMLRLKIDPRTVMTIQNQIPKLIISIVLVTFSFAIAGLLIDVMYVAMYFVFGVFSDPNLALLSDNGKAYLSPSQVQNASILDAAGGVSEGGVFGIANSAAGASNTVFKNLVGIHDICDTTKSGDCDLPNVIKKVGIPGLPLLAAPFKALVQALSGICVPLPSIFGGQKCLSNLINTKSFTPDSSGSSDLGTGIVSSDRPGLGDVIIDTVSSGLGIGVMVKLLPLTLAIFGNIIPIGYLLGPIAGGAAQATAELFLRQFLGYIILYIIFLFALVFALFRTWFELLKAYVFILVDVIFSPFWMLSGALPGEGRGIGPWIRDMLANLSAFPTVYVMFLLAATFTHMFTKDPNTSLFVPPFIGNPSCSSDPSIGGFVNCNNTNLIGSLIGFGFILLTPKALEIMRGVFKSPEFKFTAAIGESAGVGSGALGNIAKNTFRGTAGGSDITKHGKGFGETFKHIIGI